MESIKGLFSNVVETARGRLQGKTDNLISNGTYRKLRESSPGTEEKGGFFQSFNEVTFLICTICFSVSIVFFKLLYASRDYIYKGYLQGRQLWSSFSPDFNFLPRVLPTSSFTTITSVLASILSIIVDLNWLFIPALVGIAMSLFTWRIIYWDSKIPGVQPPSPFSSKLDLKSAFLKSSIGYRFAVYIGVTVFFTLLLWNMVST